MSQVFSKSVCRYRTSNARRCAAALPQSAVINTFTSYAFQPLRLPKAVLSP